MESACDLMQNTTQYDAESGVIWCILRDKVTHIASKSERKWIFNEVKKHFQSKFMATEFLFGEKTRARFLAIKINKKKFYSP